jgi:hypothetical protein
MMSPSMPGEEFYARSFQDTDFLEKFVQHHATPKNRHITQYEAERIRKIIGDHAILIEKNKVNPNSLLTYIHEESKISRTFPMNDRGHNVRSELKEIFYGSERIDIITGYSSMKEVLRAIQENPNSKIRIIFGNEPHPSEMGNPKPSPMELSSEMIKFWLEKGISILDADVVFDAIEALKEGRIEVRIGCEKRRLLHAKVYLGDEHAIIGSSNFSAGGLSLNREFNAKFHISETQRFKQINSFWKMTWGEGADFGEQFMELLINMLRKSPWREALAKAIAILLESGWMDNNLGINEEELSNALLPHQIDGLKRALWILENKGAVLIADATGSGKTKLGTWLCKTAWARKFNSSKSVNLIPPTIHMPPNVEASWDYETKMANYQPTLLPESYLSDQKKVLNPDEVEWMRKQSPVLMFDEAHHFYNYSLRGKKARDHYADSVILLSATPISKGVDDVEKCIALLGIENVDPQVLENLKDIKNNISRVGKEERLQMISRARSSLNSFTIRRTRNEINAFAEQFPEDYTIDGRLHKYPNSTALFYEMPEIKNDEKELEAIEIALQSVRGLHRIAKVIEKTEKEQADRDETILKRRVSSSKGLTDYHFWDSLIASRAAAYEHVDGTLSARKQFKITTDSREPNLGIIKKLEQWKRPIVNLDISEEEIEKLGFEFLLTDKAWRDAVTNELDQWSYILHHITRISETRDSMKVQKLADLFKAGKRTLAFSENIISLHYILGKLNTMDVRIASKNGKALVFDSSVEKSDAEKMFGLDTNQEEPLIGLLSNRFSEGVNLQSASTLLHLDTPTTVTVAEQRCGRVDRFNALHQNIEFYWPKDYGILEKVTNNKLRERNKFVEQTIGAQMKLPDDSDYEGEGADKRIYNSIEEFAEALNLQNRVEINAIDDAFSGIRRLKDELIDQEIYDMIKDTDVKVNSRVSILESSSPWFFCALGSHGKTEKPPQWVLVQFEMDKRTPIVHMTTDLTEISEFLLDELPNCEDVTEIDKENYPNWRRIFISSLRDRTTELVSPKQKSLLKQLEITVESWRKSSSWSSQNSWINAFKLAVKTGEFEGQHYDLRDIADWWFQETKVLQQKINSQKKRKKSRKKLVHDLDLNKTLRENPITFEEFTLNIGSIPTSEPLDSRMVSVIFAWPSGLKAPQRVQKFIH